METRDPFDHDPFDHLAGMFMTEGDDAPARTASSAPDEPAPAPPLRAAAEIELLVVGHLPVRASLWLGPYADAVAEDAGTVAMVRLDGEETLAQVFGAPTFPDEARDAKTAIAGLGRAVDRWIVRPAAGAAPADLLAVDADRITILSSPDQVAVVNTYRLVKELHDAAVAADHRVPAIELAILGAEPEAAEQAADRIARTTAELLGVEIPLVRVLPRMIPAVSSSGLRSFPGARRPTLDEVVAWMDDARRATPGATEAPARGVPAPDGGPVEIDRSDEAAPPSSAASPRPERSVAEPPADASRGPDGTEREADPVTVRLPASPERAAAAPPAREPVRVVRPVAPAAAAETDATGADAVPPDRGDGGAAPRRFDDPGGLVEPIPGTTARRVERWSPPADREVEVKCRRAAVEPVDHGGPVPLARHVDGLEPLAPRCPGRETVELAADASGRLHLLVREDGLRDLTFVERWAVAHRELLAMACPVLRQLRPGTVRGHVFTEEPLRVADLHGTDLQLHVLAPVEVEGRQGWYAAALNRPA